MCNAMVTGCVWLLPPVFAFLFCEVLTRPGEIFGWWPEMIERMAGMTGKNPIDYTVGQALINKWLYGCAKCMAGMLCVLSLFWWPFQSIELFAGRLVGGIFLAWWLTQRYETGRL
jgi:hypothetical protein